MSHFHNFPGICYNYFQFLSMASGGQFRVIHELEYIRCLLFLSLFLVALTSYSTKCGLYGPTHVSTL